MKHIYKSKKNNKYFQEQFKTQKNYNKKKEIMIIRI